MPFTLKLPLCWLKHGLPERTSLLISLQLKLNELHASHKDFTALAFGILTRNRSRIHQVKI